MIYPASSEARKITVFAISLDCPILPLGICDKNLFFTSVLNWSVMDVSIHPGATQLAVIPLDATSFAIDLVSPIKPDFEAA